MRLSKDQIENLKNSINQFDPDAEVLLFGSRVNDELKGGDIDILILSKIISRKDIWKIKDNFFEKFGEQKLDIIVDDGKLLDPFKKKAFNEGVIL